MADKPLAEETPVAEKPMTMADMKQLAHDYAVPMSEGTLKQISEDMTPAKARAFEDYVKTTAMGLYPTLAPQIQAGIKTAYLLDPYRQVAKQMLGEDAEPNFMSDPKASAALSGGHDPKTGRPVPMSLDEWKGHIRSHPGFGWDKTPAAYEQVDNIVQQLQAAMAGQSQAPTEMGMGAAQQAGAPSPMPTAAPGGME
jgi:hypothetical protein